MFEIICSNILASHSWEGNVEIASSIRATPHLCVKMKAICATVDEDLSRLDKIIQ